MDIFNSRRSQIFAKNGVVASSQPLASMAGIEILKQGGNAADAAVATAAALNVTEPTSTGIGGDCFALFYDGKEVKGLNGSGRSPKGLSLDYLDEKGISSLEPFSVHTVTVPGAAAGWVDTVEKFGTMEIKDVLAPAIRLAEEGFPVAPLTSRAWRRGAERQLKRWPHADEMLIDGRGPNAGEIMRNPTLAKTFREVAENGKDGFYKGRIAEKIVAILGKYGGTMTLEDLAAHRSTFEAPISTNYRGIEVFEIAPNGQGITALIGLNILEGFDVEDMVHSSPEHLHTLIETMRLSFADTRWYVADPAVVDVPIEGLLNKEYAKKRRELLNPDRATVDVQRGSPFTSSDTVYFSVADADGNACSFINSNYMGFGTGIIPEGCGFTLQNRGHNFSLERGHPNMLEPNKRPYHTIIPGMATRDGELYSSFGVMGGFMQPQGHMQVISNMVDFRMNPQQALDAPRFCIGDGMSNGRVNLEEGISVKTMSKLSQMGHNVIPTAGFARTIFGRGQIINRVDDVWEAGSDPRADGQAIGY